MYKAKSDYRTIKLPETEEFIEVVQYLRHGDDFNELVDYVIESIGDDTDLAKINAALMWLQNNNFVKYRPKKDTYFTEVRFGGLVKRIRKLIPVPPKPKMCRSPIPQPKERDRRAPALRLCAEA